MGDHLKTRQAKAVDATPVFTYRQCEIPGQRHPAAAGQSARKAIVCQFPSFPNFHRAPTAMILALASPRVASSLEDGLAKVKECLSEASAQNAAIVCFPEAYLPGLRGVGIDVFPFGQAAHARMLAAVPEVSRSAAVPA